MTPRWIWRLAEALARAGAMRPVVDLATGIRFVVRGDSMAPTLSDGDYVLVSRLAYRVGKPTRGDIVVVRAAWGAGLEYLKRVVGLPGETVRYEDGSLFVESVAVPEPYLPYAALPVEDGLLSWQLGSDEYLVFGDYRPRSTDSRQHGPVTREALVGRAYYRYWPLERRGRVGTSRGGGAADTSGVR